MALKNNANSFLYIIPIGPVDDELLDVIREGAHRSFRIQTRIEHRKIDLLQTFDTVRNQYHASKLLLQIIEAPPADAIRILGITEVDLFLPIFTFLFGQAQLNGVGAILSTLRLHNSFYGIPEDKLLLQERAIKETVHELGHTFGLIHCFDPVCVMQASTYVEDVDQKGLDFCDNCRGQLELVLGESVRKND